MAGVPERVQPRARGLARHGGERPGSGAAAVVVRDTPLISVTDDAGQMVIAIGGDNSHSDRIVEHLVTLRVDRAADGSERGLEIEDEAGDLLRLRFRTAIPPELVDGAA